MLHHKAASPHVELLVARAIDILFTRMLASVDTQKEAKSITSDKPCLSLAEWRSKSKESPAP